MEKVNHPSHYNIEGKKECIVQMEEDFGAKTVVRFCLTNAYKYLYRAGNKSGETVDDDISKAKWYIDYATKMFEENKLTSTYAIAKLYESVTSKYKNHTKGE